ncbi:fibronectin type III domain-containing protein [Cohnella cholangitidis]|uniref:Fibronectin type III domain-containing protein n=1 Tax=Cohnella cholangitidis TaxID=2598458 RepID=A0A7G5BTA1_9BACL|nr:fibronectin type III domain-containing protein [Cohnella cholangitidis]QMV40185.1 fibronectin type III domain-containing protein [Cohnella cholangitidis]
MKVKIIVLFLSFTLLLSLTVPLSSVSAYTGGLLENKPVHYGMGKDSSAGTTTLITDNDESTSFTLHAQNASLPTVYDNAFYNFSVPHLIGSYRLLTDAPGRPNLTFLNASGVVIKTITPVTDGSLQFIQTVPGVKSVYLSNGFSTATKVFEFDVFDAVSPDVPILAATEEVNQITLSWSSITNATHYTIKRSLTSGGPYTTIANNIIDLNFVDTNVMNGTTYYYVITATSLNGESPLSNEVSASPLILGRALLTITMTNGLEKEYDLSMAELHAFISWYDAKGGGTGPAKYKFTKTWNKGPFKARSEYVIFDKILAFDVDEYDVTP